MLLLGAGGALNSRTAPRRRHCPTDRNNRSPGRAHELARLFAAHGNVVGCGLGEIAGNFDLVINATSASLAGESFDSSGRHTPPDFGLRHDVRPQWTLPRRRQPTGRGIADGLGMLVEQAARPFSTGGIRPDTALPVLADLRARISAHEAFGPLAQVGLLGILGVLFAYQLWLLGWVLFGAASTPGPPVSWKSGWPSCRRNAPTRPAAAMGALRPHFRPSQAGDHRRGRCQVRRSRGVRLGRHPEGHGKNQKRGRIVAGGSTITQHWPRMDS